jgi:hypothetical protein
LINRSKKEAELGTKLENFTLGAFGLDRTLIPSSRAAKEDWTDLVLSSSKWVRTQEEIAGLPELDIPLTGEEKGRRRFAHNLGPVGLWRHLGPRYGRGFTLYWKVLPEKVKRKVLGILDTINIFRKDITASGLYMILHKLSDIAKKHGDMLFQDIWKWLVNLELLGGYRQEIPIELFEAEIRDWVQGEVEHTLLGSEEKFLVLLKAGMRDFLSELPGVRTANARLKSIAEWSRDISTWARPGSSSSNLRLMYKVKGEEGERSARRTKWATALVTDSDYIERILRMGLDGNPDLIKGRLRAIEKRETGKVRAVAASDDETYWRMSFISDWLEAALKGSTKSTLYMSREQLLEFWRIRADQTRTDTVKLPLDQRHFDWQQNRAMIGVFFDVIEEVLVEVENTDIRKEILSVLAVLRASLTVSEEKFRGSVRVGEAEVKINKGILSGWKWTALMDTVFNWGELFAAKAVVDGGQPRKTVVSANAQGDDDQIECSSWGGATGLVFAYEEMGFDLNPSKFFLDTKRDEYLRQVATPTEVSGYPARIVNSLLWRNPVSKEPPRGLLRAGEQVKTWGILLGRGGDRQAIDFLMTRDLMGGNGLSKSVVEGLLATPVTLGGLGWRISLDREKWLKIENGQVKKEARLQSWFGLKSELGRWREEWGVTFKYEEINKVLLELVDLPKAKVVTEVGRVERVDWRIRIGDIRDVDPIQTGIPLAARADPALPSVLRNLARDNAVRERNWEWVDGVWITPTDRDVSRAIRQRGGVRLWRDWLTGSLPWKTPIYPGVADLQISALSQSILQAKWNKLASKQKYNYTAVVRIGLETEFLTIMQLEKEVNSFRIGG